MNKLWIASKQAGLVLIALMMLAADVLAQSRADAMRLIDNQEYKKALEMLDQLMTSTTKERELAQLVYSKGFCYLEMAAQEEDADQKTKQLEQAKAFFVEGLDKSSKFPYNYMGLGSYLAQTGNAAEAEKNLKKAYEIAPSDASLLAELAGAYLFIKTKAAQDEAEKLLTRAQTIDAKNPQIFLSLGDFYMERNIEELPLSNYQKAVALMPNLVRAHYRMGQYHVKYKKYQDGANSLKKAIELDAKFAPAYQELGELYFKAKAFTEAKDFYKKYVDLRGKDFSARYRYAQFLYLSKEYDAAINEISIAQKELGVTNVMLRLLAYCYYETKRIPEARKNIDEYFSKIKPTNIIAKDYEYRGKIAMAEAKIADNKYDENKLDVGVADVLKSLELDNTRSDLYQEVVKIYTTARLFTKAVAVQRRAVAADPSINNYYTLGRLHALNKQYTSADSAFKKVVEKRANFVPGWLELARANLALEDSANKGKAKPFYEKIIELAKSDEVKYKKELAESYLYMAFYEFQVTKDNKKCLEYLEKGMQMNPDYEQGKELQNYLLKDLKLKPGGSGASNGGSGQ